MVGVVMDCAFLRMLADKFVAGKGYVIVGRKMVL